jgi:peptidoglycan-associated lipoprotein
MTDGMGGVQTGGANGMLSPEEQMRQKFEALQRDNVIYFPYDGYDIQGQYADLLDAHASYLRERPSVKVLIEGHADERGTPEYNIALGERRAKAVAKYLQTLGVQAEQLSIVSYGEEKPRICPTPRKPLPEPPCGPGLLRFESNEVRLYASGHFDGRFICTKRQGLIRMKSVSASDYALAVYLH